MRFRNLKDRLVFYTCLSTMLQAGLPFDRTLDILIKTMEDDEQKESLEICSFLHSKISGGAEIAKAFQATGEAFPRYAAGTIKAAQNTGRIDHALLTLARIEEKEHALRKKLESALRYPLIIAFVGLLIMFVMASFLGNLQSVFEDLGASIPFYLKAMITVADWLFNPLFLLGLVGVVVLGYRKLSQPKFQRWLRDTSIRLGIPVFSRAIVLSANIHFCRLLGMQLEAGCNFLPALVRALEGTGDPLLIMNANARRPDSIVHKVSHGMTLSEALERSGYFSSHLVSMLRVSEEHGLVDKTLLAVADFLQDELDYRLATFASLVEPLFIVATGFGVGVMAVGTFLPLLDVMNV